MAFSRAAEDASSGIVGTAFKKLVRASDGVLTACRHSNVIYNNA